MSPFELPSPPIVTLTTDFGLRDEFVGVMKGVILSINPNVQVIDISHEITPHRVEEAAYVVGAAYRFFPRGTVHVVVVDPGVGSPRRPLLATTNDFAFVAPDNGVLTHIFHDEPPTCVVEITAAEYRLTLPPGVPPSATFHGRDIFAPAAAWFTRRPEPQAFGPEVAEWITLPFPEPTCTSRGLEGRVIHVDRFGNLITNIRPRHLETIAAGSRRAVRAAYRGVSIAIRKFYAEGVEPKASHIVEPKASHIEDPVPIALFNSAGYLEIAIYRGRAADRLGGKVGDPVGVQAGTGKATRRQRVG